MIILLSPAKTLDYEKLETNASYTVPLLLEKSKILINDLKKKKPSEISKLMKISDKLSSLNSERYKSWRGLKEKSKNSKEAIFVFKGDVYQGLNIESFKKKDLEYSQNHLRLISGLYGLLKPLDIIEPYRLEMGTKLETRKGKNLYEFWGKEISDQLVKDLKSLKSNTVINLASNEYFNSVKDLEKTTNIISPVFRDFSKDKYKVISFYAKKARGLMAGWILKNKIKKEEIKDFDIDGYYYSKKDSLENSPVFLRD